MAKPSENNKQDLKPLFIENRRQFLTISKACKVTGIHRSTYYDWCDKDPDFAKQDEDAKQEALDLLEENSFERAMTGKDHSSALLSMFILKAYRPQFKDRMLLEHSSPAITAQEDADKVFQVIDDMANRQLPAAEIETEAPSE